MISVFIRIYQVPVRTMKWRCLPVARSGKHQKAHCLIIRLICMRVIQFQSRWLNTQKICSATCSLLEFKKHQPETSQKLIIRKCYEYILEPNLLTPEKFTADQVVAELINIKIILNLLFQLHSSRNQFKRYFDTIHELSVLVSTYLKIELLLNFICFRMI